MKLFWRNTDTFSKASNMWWWCNVEQQLFKVFGIVIFYRLKNGFDVIITWSSRSICKYIFCIAVCRAVKVRNRRKSCPVRYKIVVFVPISVFLGVTDILADGVFRRRCSNLNKYFGPIFRKTFYFAHHFTSGRKTDSISSP